MSELKVKFVRHGGRKSFELTCSTNEKLKTVLQQFCLSLPLNEDYKNLDVAEINHIELSKKERYSFNDFAKAAKAVDQDDKLQMLLQGNLQRLFISSSELSQKEARKLFKKIPYTSYEADGFWYYYLNRDMNAPTEDENNAESTKSDSSSNNHDFDYEHDDLTKVEKFSELQRYAILLQKTVQSQNEAVNDLRKMAFDASNSVYDIQEQLDKVKTSNKGDQKLNSFLTDQFDAYLHSSDKKLELIQEFLKYYSTPSVQKIINHSSDNMLKLIDAICNFDTH